MLHRLFLQVDSFAVLNRPAWLDVRLFCSTRATEKQRDGSISTMPFVSHHLGTNLVARSNRESSTSLPRSTFPLRWIASRKCGFRGRISRTTGGWMTPRFKNLHDIQFATSQQPVSASQFKTTFDRFQIEPMAGKIFLLKQRMDLLGE